jgi:hypothetical protein
MLEKEFLDVNGIISIQNYSLKKSDEVCIQSHTRIQDWLLYLFSSVTLDKSNSLNSLVS